MRAEHGFAIRGYCARTGVIDGRPDSNARSWPIADTRLSPLSTHSGRSGLRKTVYGGNAKGKEAVDPSVGASCACSFTRSPRE